jgi:hypothetical protein
MAYPSIIQTVSAVEPYGGSSLTIETPASSLSPIEGDSAYIFIFYNGGSTSSPVSVASVVDNASNYYLRAGKVQYSSVSQPTPTMEIWYTDNAPANSNLRVSVTFSASLASEVAGVVVAAIVRGAAGVGSVDIVSAGQAASSTSSSDPLTSLSPNDLIIAVQCTVNGMATSSLTSGGGFTNYYGASNGVASGASASYDVLASMYTDGPSLPDDFNSSLSWIGSLPYAILTVAIRSPRCGVG